MLIIDVINQDFQTQLNDVDPHDRKKWRKQNKDSLVLSTPDSGTMAAP